MRVIHWIRRGLALVLLAALTCWPAAPALAAAADLVPLRFLAEATGATVEWDGETRTVTVVTDDGVTATLQIGATEAVVDGQAVPIGAEAIIVDDRTMVPQAFMDSLLAMPVTWDPEAREARVDPYVLQAHRLARDLLRGELSTVHARFSPALQEAVSPELLLLTGLQLASYGEPGRPQVLGASTTAVHHNVDLLVPFTQAPLKVTIRFDGEGRVDDFRIDAYAPVPVAGDPPYADPESFTEKEVVIGEAPWALPGTLTLPAGEGPFPAVVLVHGSGPVDRDETAYAVKPFRDLAQGLAAQGIATLRFDKRTYVHSQKFGSNPEFTLQEESVEDALAAVRLLAADERIARDQIYVLGHSLGGLALPRIFAQDEEGLIRGGIAMAAPNSMLDTLWAQNRILVESGQLPPEQLEFIKPQLDMLRDPAFDPDNPPEGYALGTPHYWHDLVPKASELLREQQQPILFLQGARDFQVPVSEFESLQADLAGRTNLTFQLFPKLNHLFTEGEGEMSTMAEYMVAANVPEYVVQAIADWIHSQPE
ncbi:MAG: alpha/beta fold hydrolase [Symbiobacterium sp.]|uniref:alpha/beta hydrolase family protein n=1 Tax=Symbiobacterium sp. TaxID=1971213 RepID=UPI003463E4E2